MKKQDRNGRCREGRLYLGGWADLGGRGTDWDLSHRKAGPGQVLRLAGEKHHLAWLPFSPTTMRRREEAFHVTPLACVSIVARQLIILSLLWRAIHGEARPCCCLCCLVVVDDGLSNPSSSHQCYTPLPVVPPAEPGLVSVKPKRGISFQSTLYETQPRQPDSNYV